MRRTFWIQAILFWLAVAARSIAAEPAPADISRSAEATRRHVGTFFRPDLGFGYLHASASGDGQQATITGAATSFGVAVGGALSENNLLAFHIWDIVATNPTLTVNGESGTVADTTLTVIGFGPQYTHYTDDNVYFSVTPSLTRASITIAGEAADTDWGFGLRAAAGKEWWISDHWGLGVAGHLTFSSNSGSGANGMTWSGWSTAVTFSASYN